MNNPARTWATPLAIGSFTISAVTGVLIFFDIEMGLVEPVHKWLSWLLVSGVVLHVVANWKAFAGYFARKPALAVMGAAALVTIASLMPFFGEEEEEGSGKKIGIAATHALEGASLETVALVVKTSPVELAGRLAAKGLKVNDHTKTISEIAASNGKDGGYVLAELLGPQEGTPDRD